LLPTGALNEIHGARNVAGQAVAFSRRARFTRPALLNGEVGFVVAPGGKLLMVGVFQFDLVRKVIVEMELIADPRKLSQLDIATL
jgi:RNA polymerase sigma-70 factor (ECF subfamily)